MSAVVYYFSGTGNSLVVAKDVAVRINADLVAVSDRIEEDKIKTDSDMIGIVFPRTKGNSR